MAKNKKQIIIYCVDDEPIVLKRLSETISLHIDSRKYELPEEEASNLGQWLVSQIGLDDSRSTPTNLKKRNKKSPKQIEGTVEGLIWAGLLEIGTVLTLTYRGKDHQAKVSANGQLEYAGRFFDDPSPACVKATGQISCNGWTSWKTPGGDTLDDLRRKL